MICVPAEIEIDDKSILAQMERVKEAQYKLEKEMDNLNRMIMNTKAKEKRGSEESLRNNGQKSKGFDRYGVIAEFQRLELEEAEKEKKSKKKRVCIDTDSVIGKEIKYQTALLHEILDEVRRMLGR